RDGGGPPPAKGADLPGSNELVCRFERAHTLRTVPQVRQHRGHLAPLQFPVGEGGEELGIEARGIPALDGHRPSSAALVSDESDGRAESLSQSASPKSISSASPINSVTSRESSPAAS